MIAVENIHKAYGKGKALVKAVRGLSFEVREGEIFGLIGPDGAGKTTLFRILATLMLPDTGKATIDGMDVVKNFRKLRHLIGYMPGRFSLYQDLSVEENLEFFATVFGTTIAENFDLISDIYVQLEPFKRRRAGKLSGGMKQKLALCCALIHNPRILLLDEPTTGVDPVSRKEFWDMLGRLREKDITILVSTPYMDEASRCNRVALVTDGHLLSIDTPAGIRASYPHRLWELEAMRTYPLLKSLERWGETHSAYAFGEAVHFAAKNREIEAAEISAFLATQGLEDVEIRPVQADIEDCFMEFMQNQHA